MKITIVNFSAYSTRGARVFIDKTEDEIHSELFNLCSSYVPLSRIEADSAEYRTIEPFLEAQGLQGLNNQKTLLELNQKTNGNNQDNEPAGGK